MESFNLRVRRPMFRPRTQTQTPPNPPSSIVDTQTHSPPPPLPNPSRSSDPNGGRRRPLLFPTSDPFVPAPAQDPPPPSNTRRGEKSKGAAAHEPWRRRGLVRRRKRASLRAAPSNDLAGVSRAWHLVRCGRLYYGEVSPAASTRAADVRRLPRRGTAVFGGHRPGRLFRPAGVAHRPPPRRPASPQAPDLKALGAPTDLHAKVKHSS
jgi:hypothetical protein